jgi:hypothetical protein
MAQTYLFVSLTSSSILGITASAGLIPVTQDRHVHASAFAQGLPGGNSASDLQTFSATDMGPFQQSASASAITNSNGASNSDQNSSISASLLAATGSAAAQAVRRSQTYASGTSRSVYTVVFDVAIPTQVQLTGMLLTSGSHTQDPMFVTATGSVRLTFGDSPLAEHAATLPTQPSTVFDSAHTLQPGRYTLTARCDSFLDSSPYPDGQGTSSASFEVQLTVVPGPATLTLLSLAGCAVPRRRRPTA